MTIEVNMTVGEYNKWMQLRDGLRKLKGKNTQVRKVTAKIDDPAIIAKIKFLHEKEMAATYGAEQLFDKARSHKEDIWLAIHAELPEHFPGDFGDSDNDVQYDANGNLKLGKGMTYNHVHNQLHYIILEEIDDEGLTVEKADSDPLTEEELKQTEEIDKDVADGKYDESDPETHQ